METIIILTVAIIFLVVFLILLEKAKTCRAIIIYSLLAIATTIVPPIYVYSKFNIDNVSYEHVATDYVTLGTVFLREDCSLPSATVELVPRPDINSLASDVIIRDCNVAQPGKVYTLKFSLSDKEATNELGKLKTNLSK